MDGWMIGVLPEGTYFTVKEAVAETSYVIRRVAETVAHTR